MKNSSLQPPFDLLAAPGHFLGTIENLSTDAVDTLFRRRLQRKAWVFIGAYNERYALGFAVVDAGAIATAFLYLYDRDRDELLEEKILQPIGFPADFEPNLNVTWHVESGDRSFRLHKIDSTIGTPQYCAEYRNGRDYVRITLVDNLNWISALNHTPGRPFQYTAKNVGVEAFCSVEYRGSEFEIETSHAIIDFSLGYPPRHAEWQWACLSGSANDGKLVGINAVAQYFNGLESALWHPDLPEKRQFLPQVVFDYDTDNVLKPWSIYSTDGAVDVRFTPDGLRQENIKLGIVNSRFQQPFGKFDGTVGIAGEKITVSGFGVVEQHSATW